MTPQGTPTPRGGGQPIPASLLRSNSSLLSGQGGGMPSQNGFPSLMSPRNQFNHMNMLGNGPNVSSLLHQSLGNGVPSNGGAEADPLSNGMNFNGPSSSGQQQFMNPSSSQMFSDQHGQQVDPQSFQQNQQQFSIPTNPQQQLQQSQQQYRAGLGGVKMEPQMGNEQTMQALRNLGSVKMEPQQSMRSLGPVKMEPHHLDSPLFMQQQQQQLLMARQNSQAAAAAQVMYQQRIMQIQHQQQQQQLLKSMSPQRPPVQSQQFQQQNMPIRSPGKPIYEPGMCARRLTHYMYQQQHRPEDNNIEFWRKFVAEYFAPNAKKKWCVSMYGNGRQTTGVFPQDIWHCEICNRKPGRGFEATAEVLPRLFKIKYESGTLEELLYVDMPREYQNSSGQIVLDYAKAIQESVFEQLRVVRDGQLRIVFSPDLKICSWEFCARRHEELIPRRLLIPQVGQLGAAAQKYQVATQNGASTASVSELQNNCNAFVASARQLAKALEVPLVNDLGYTKRYVRCLQISEVVNSMKDLIDYSRETSTGPMESLAKFPRRTNTSPGGQSQSQQPDSQLHQQSQTTTSQNTNSENPIQSNGILTANSTLNSVPVTSSGSNIVGLLHQNSMNPRPMPNNTNSPYGPNNVQMSSPVPQAQSPFQSPTPSSSNNPQPIQQPAISGDTDANDSQSSVQKIINDMVMSSQLGGSGMMGMGEVKNVNGILSSSNNGGMGINGSNILAGNGIIGGSGFGNMGNGAMMNGIRATLANNNNNMNNSLSMNGRVNMAMAREQSMNLQQQQQQQRDLSNQLFSGLGSVNGFGNLPFDWKGSP